MWFKRKYFPWVIVGGVAEAFRVSVRVRGRVMVTVRVRVTVMVTVRVRVTLRVMVRVTVRLYYN